MSTRRGSLRRRTASIGPLGHRDFALLWSGQTVSVAGDGIFTVALAIQTLRTDDRPEALAFVLAARLLPTVALLLLGGVIVDRIPRRLAMFASDLVRGVVVAAIAVLVVTRSLDLAELIVMAVVFGVADAFFMPASTAIVPEILPEAVLVRASSLSSLSQVLAQQLLGPALGGVLVAAIGTGASFALDGASFAVSAGCLLAMSRRPRPPAAPDRSTLSQAREGLAYVRSQPWLWASILGAGLANFAMFAPLGVLIPLLIRHTLHRGAVSLGLTLAAGGAGGAVAAVAIGRRELPHRPILAIWIGWGIGDIVATCIGLTTQVWEVAILYGIGGAMLMWGNALWTPLLQKLVPRHLLGRVSSVDWLVSIALTPLGTLVAGVLATTIGVRATILVGGALSTLSSLVVLVPGARDPDRRSSVAAEPDHGEDGTVSVQSVGR